jgi:serine/threonine-protein kinase
MALEVGDTLDEKYRIVRAIGVGGMGTVYEGEHTLIRRRVAIKVLADDSAQTPDSVRRFEREAQAAGQIGSDHILEVLDIGRTADGHRYIVMEYLDGETLATRLERVGHMTPAQIAPLARQVLAGLAAAHAAGIVHRDLKPGNVFILREKAGHRDFVKIIDFGISKFEQPGGGPSRLTQSGAVLGTPYYMSPEQARGTTVDPRSDLHACGVILFEAVTGRMPFEGKNFNELMFQIATGKRPRPRDYVPDLDPRFEALVTKAMERDPEKRYQSARDFAKDLEAWMTANSLSTTTGEVLLADVAPLLAGTTSTELGRGAVTLDAADAAIVGRRTVTNASVDTLAPMVRRRRMRWIALGVGAGSGFAIVTAMLVTRQAPAPATSGAGPEPLPSAAAVQPSAMASASTSPTTAAMPTAKLAPLATQDAADAGGVHGQDPRHKTKPAKGASPHPTATGKVDFGY